MTRDSLFVQKSFRVRTELVSAFLHPKANLFFDGKTRRGISIKLGCQCEGMGLERHGEVGMSSKETANQKLHVALYSKDLKLDRVHQCVKEGAVRDSFVRHYDVQEGQRFYFFEAGQI